MEDTGLEPKVPLHLLAILIAILGIVSCGGNPSSAYLKELASYADSKSEAMAFKEISRKFSTYMVQFFSDSKKIAPQDSGNFDDVTHIIISFGENFEISQRFNIIDQSNLSILLGE